jgi:hypothetical protein
VSVAQAPVGVSEWVVPYLLFGLTVFIMEGYRERRPTRIYALPALFLGWSFADSSWGLGVVFTAWYLGFPRIDRPHLRRHLGYLLILSLVLGLATQALFPGPFWASFRCFPQDQVPLDCRTIEALAAMGIPTLMCLVVYWNKLMAPHRWNTLIFAFLAPWDGRLAALFAMVGAVLLCATVFRDSVDSSNLRPFFKHFEWHYFWYVFGLAVWAYLNRWGLTAGLWL